MCRSPTRGPNDDELNGAARLTGGPGWSAGEGLVDGEATCVARLKKGK